jgi:hypothetical protein
LPLLVFKVAPAPLPWTTSALPNMVTEAKGGQSLRLGMVSPVSFSITNSAD